MIASRLRRPCVMATLMIGAAGMMACRSHETGPSLSMVVETTTLVPSSSEVDAASLCCCRVRGTLRNTSSITVHVNVNFDAQGATGLLGTALDWVPNVAPGALAPFEAVGISAACSQVTGITGRHFLTGVFVGSGGS